MANVYAIGRYNTVAGFSKFIDPERSTRPSAYTVRGHTERAPTIAGSEGFWRRFPDVFDPRCRQELRQTLENQAERIRSPWCLGVFIDNEQDFGYDDGVPYLVPGVIASPADQPAKLAFIAWLKERYHSVEGLNAAWSSNYADWRAFAVATTYEENTDSVVADILGFKDVLLNTYFSICHEELRRIDTDVLYLDCRFSGRAPARVVEALAAHADVLTYNLYHQSMSHLRLPASVNLPILLGEFHFGHVGGNHFHPGLVPQINQYAVATAFERFLEEGADHPQVIGMHWFCWADQPTTGRSLDGENFNCGLIDITDRPKKYLTSVTQRFMKKLYGA